MGRKLRMTQTIIGSNNGISNTRFGKDQVYEIGDDLAYKGADYYISERLAGIFLNGLEQEYGRIPKCAELVEEGDEISADEIEDDEEVQKILAQEKAMKVAPKNKDAADLKEREKSGFRGKLKRNGK